MARAWATGRGGSARPEDASDPITAELLRRRAATIAPGDGEIEIGASDAAVVHLFFALGTQWRRAGMAGIRVGLDYASVPATAAMIGVEVTPGLFLDLQAMERAAAREFAK